MVRPRTYSDDALLQAAHHAILDLGDRATLSDIGKRAGVTPAALTKRFGSKHGLLVQLSRRWVTGIDAELAAAEASVADPVEKILSVATSGAGELDRPEQVGTQLSGLADDLRDPELRELLSEGWGKLRQRLEELFATAADQGHLLGAPPPRQAARILLSLVQGGSLYWSLNPQGSLVTEIRSDVRALLINWTDHQETHTTRTTHD